MELVNTIRRSSKLCEVLDAHTDARFFVELETFEEGRAFLKLYADWIERWGHRGHADRDYMYPRRSEDPSIDVRAFKLMMNVDADHDPAAHEREIARARDAFFEAVLARVGTQPRGSERAETLRYVYRLIHEYAAIRDNERAHPTDTLTFARKRGYVEIGRRLYERGQIEDPLDFHYLSEIELFQMFRGRIEARGLIAAKIRARARNVGKMLRKEAHPPLHLQRHRPVDLEHPPETTAAGVFKGAPTSPGVVTATARVIMQHSEMIRVKKGEILVTHSTDPGWNPVFGVISGVVIETGGMLSHASCLAREYGFPAVHLPRAASLIPDGATITLDGHTGMVTIVTDDKTTTGSAGTLRLRDVANP
jgi:pyruvate,water dikinase